MANMTREDSQVVADFMDHLWAVLEGLHPEKRKLLREQVMRLKAARTAVITTEELIEMLEEATEP